MSATEKPGDRWFRIAGRLLIIAVLAVSVLDTRSPTTGPLLVLGLILLTVGLLLNILSRLYLGKYYSESVRIRADHLLVTKGPYRIIRHPIYLSVILFTLSAPIIFDSLYAFIIALAIIPMILHRVKIEEERLAIRFGKEYAEYCKRTRKLIPYVH